MLAVPGAMDAGLGDILFWGALSFALVIAGVVAFPVNRWLIATRQGPRRRARDRHPRRPADARRGRVAALAAVFGGAVLVAEAVGEDERHGGGRWPAATAAAPSLAGHERAADPCAGSR